MYRPPSPVSSPADHYHHTHASPIHARDTRRHPALASRGIRHMECSASAPHLLSSAPLDSSTSPPQPTPCPLARCLPCHHRLIAVAPFACDTKAETHSHPHTAPTASPAFTRVVRFVCSPRIVSTHGDCEPERDLGHQRGFRPGERRAHQLC